MANPKHVLLPNEYRRFRNVRAVLILYVLFGILALWLGVAVTIDKSLPPLDRKKLLSVIGSAVFGVTCLVGSVAAWRGHRRWAGLVYLPAVIQLFLFPIGTILGLVVLRNLSWYLDSLARVRAEDDLYQQFAVGRLGYGRAGGRR